MKSVMFTPYAIKPPASTSSRKLVIVGSRPFTASSATRVAVREERRGTAEQKRLGPLARHGGEGAIELLRTSCLHVLQADAQRSGGSLHLFHLNCKTCVCLVRQDGHSRRAGIASFRICSCLPKIAGPGA